MLGKLIKHELRHSARYHFAILIATAAITVVVSLSLITQSGRFLATFGLVITGFATIIVTLVSIIKNFYDTIFSRLGYLTMTLPVKGSQLLLSKIIVAIIWVVVGYVSMAIPYIPIAIFAKIKAQEFSDVLGDSGIGAALSSFLPSTSAMAAFLAVALLIAFIYIITYIGYIYFSVTIANTRIFQNHPKLFGALTFFAITTFVTRVGSLLSRVIPFTFYVTQEKAMFAFKAVDEISGAVFSPYSLADVLFSGIVGIGLLFLTSYIIENKINIK